MWVPSYPAFFFFIRLLPSQLERVFTLKFTLKIKKGVKYYKEQLKFQNLNADLIKSTMNY